MLCFTHRTVESLYKELVEEGLLIQSLKVNLSDYIGKAHQGQCVCVTLQPGPEVQPLDRRGLAHAVSWPVLVRLR